jgi:hypothetical protein
LGGDDTLGEEAAPGRRFFCFNEGFHLFKPFVSAVSGENKNAISTWHMLCFIDKQQSRGREAQVESRIS